MMTGHPGLFAGGDMVPSERTVTVAVGHGKKAARHIDAWLRGDELRQAAPARARELRQAPRLVLHRRRAAAAEGARDRRAARELRRGGRRAQRGRGAVRGAPLPVLRQLLRVRRLLRRLPGARDHQARPRQALPLRLRAVHGLRDLLRAVPVPRDRDDPGARRHEHRHRRDARDRRALGAAPPACAQGRDDRRQRGRGLGRLPRQRGLRDLPDHAVLADGRARRPVGERGQDQHLGQRARP